MARTPQHQTEIDGYSVILIINENRIEYATSTEYGQVERAAVSTSHKQLTKVESRASDLGAAIDKAKRFLAVEMGEDA